MQISIKVENLGNVREVLAKLSGPQARGAYAKAVNDTAFQVRRAMKEEMAKVFDRPTPYILNSSYVQMATPDKLSARIAPENKRDSVGVDPQKILQAQELAARAVTSAASWRFAVRASSCRAGKLPSRPLPTQAAAMAVATCAGRL